MIGSPLARPSKHTRPLVRRRPTVTGDVLMVVGSYSLTKPRPWDVRAERRRKNKVARAARKRNRP